jgi:hypothetical protein
MSVRAHDDTGDDEAPASLPTSVPLEVPPPLAADGSADDGDATDTLQTYLREIRRAPLLSPDE